MLEEGHDLLNFISLKQLLTSPPKKKKNYKLIDEIKIILFILFFQAEWYNCQFLWLFLMQIVNILWQLYIFLPTTEMRKLS